ncbi:MAG: hypothetical protein QOE80_1129 [Actinomycetota bacterium]|nr:hypothetical protein [Actinomycetota bacterium]
MGTWQPTTVQAPIRGEDGGPVTKARTARIDVAPPQSLADAGGDDYIIASEHAFRFNAQSRLEPSVMTIVLLPPNAQTAANRTARQRCATESTGLFLSEGRSAMAWQTLSVVARGGPDHERKEAL